ncbi:ATP-binding cassette domain-containing protein [Bifidobacterium sp. SMB2]|uniref:ATP-binding cassette domain-containing protein n=1 Tax=Bifidobacterium saimiriisciurei TaxID=2661627 RepID=A0ABX0CHP0_9BIFI|nr:MULTISPECIES: ATP-binding cassette domain-containing protein [Bifidobacterium]NEG96273.1 ATP-binding cassette domain-containing protein [Bifidobacterium sp. SMB2]NEH12354.1 ATP-binding cassette domain-containing protein [Bifidobacterium saimiriisciurei]
MIEIERLVKSFGAKKAVDQVSFKALNGRVTGFLGPNGAGKSTTMKALLGLIRPDSGEALIDGRPFSRLSSPMRSVGAVLDARSVHKGMTAYAHLRSLALTNGIPKSRVDEVIDVTGIASVKNRRAGTFSLGMSQRLSIAAALLGDPHNLVLDEPINGLDPEGVKWVRELCRYYAAQGRAVLLSSHLMSEVALTADDLVIIGQGRILRQVSVARFVDEHSSHGIRIVTPDPRRVHEALAELGGAQVRDVPRESGDPSEGYAVMVDGVPMQPVAQILAHNQVVMYRFSQEQTSLEDAYMELTHAAAEYRAKSPMGEGGAPDRQPDMRPDDDRRSGIRNRTGRRAQRRGTRR